jgi:hypothetical protein
MSREKADLESFASQFKMSQRSCAPLWVSPSNKQLNFLQHVLIRDLHHRSPATSRA